MGQADKVAELAPGKGGHAAAMFTGDQLKSIMTW